MAPTDDRQATAFHEAGHFVASLEREGFVRQEISIVPDDERQSLGHSTTEDPWPRPEESGWRFAVEEVEALVVELFAGYAAQVRRFPSARAAARLGASTDNERARDYLRSLPKGSRARLRARTRRVVARRWPEICALAKELLDRGRLDGDEAELVCDVAAGRVSQADLDRWRMLRPEAPSASLARFERLAPNGHL